MPASGAEPDACYTCSAMPDSTISILGGTGDQGLGLALRFCGAGRKVRIGSRKLDRALEAAENVSKQVADARVEGLENGDATVGAEVVILSVPFEHTAGTVKAIRAHRTMMLEQAMFCGGQLVDNHRLFSDDMTGEIPWRPMSVTRWFAIACRAADINNVRLHDLSRQQTRPTTRLVDDVQHLLDGRHKGGRK